MNAAGPKPRRLVFTLDLEDHRPDESYEKRYPQITHSILEFLDTRKITATVFVLGRIARDEPTLVREIADRGHEIGFHSFGHTHLTDETPQRLRAELTEYKAYLEDLSGKPVIGYRAPAFSLTRASSWAVDVIREAGFTYSSSVLPAKSPIFGFPGIPRRAFRWPNGLLEIPAPVARFGPLVLPFLGGFYLRYIPAALLERFLRQGDEHQVYWLYCHPHDFDHGETFYQIAGTSFMTSVLLWFNRKNTFRKLERIVSSTWVQTGTHTFAGLIDEGEFEQVPEFAL